MEALEAILPELLARVRARGCIILSDFDGTLCPIVPRYEDAVLSEETREALEACAKRYRVAVISGRSVEDLRARIAIEGLAYGGSHGVEISFPGQEVQLRCDEESMRRFAGAKEALSAVALRFAKVSLEDKRFSFAVHYRELSEGEQREFRAQALAAIRPHLDSGAARVIDHYFTFDLVACPAVTKGTAVRELIDLFWRSFPRALPIYAGDGTTDEDAFIALAATEAVTIRVGESGESAAKCFVPTREAVDELLRSLASL